MEIRDWGVARELDVAAARLLHEEEITRDAEREKRDRKFWIVMLGSESSDDSESMPLENQPVLSESHREAHAKFLAAIENNDIEQLRKKPGRRKRVRVSGEGIVFPLGEE
jgi:hypothetical protein